MKKNIVSKKNLVLGLASAFLSVTAMASVNVNNFAPAVNPAYLYSEDALMSTHWGAKGQGRAFFGAYYSLVNDPLVELDNAHSRRRSLLVDSMNSLNLSFGYGISQRLQAGVSTSMNLIQMPGQSQQFGFGDSRLFTKFRLNSEYDIVTLALMPELFIPTGNRNLFLSNSGFGAGLKLVAEHDFGPVQIVGNLGYRYSPEAIFRDLDMRQAVPVSLGALIPLGSRWALNADARADLSIPYNKYTNPSSFYGGGRYKFPSSSVTATLGAAGGALNNYSSADYSIIAGVMIMPESRPEPVVLPPMIPVVEKKAEKPRVVFTPKEVVVTEEVKFEHGKAILTPSGENLLDEVAKVLKENEKYYTAITIEGHTNQIGSHGYNNKLSKERAAAVKEYLVSRGVSDKALKVTWYGKTRPKNIPGLSKQAALVADRRVEFKVENKPKDQQEKEHQAVSDN